MHIYSLVNIMFSFIFFSVLYIVALCTRRYAQRFFSSSHEGSNYTTRRFMVFREKKMTEGRYMHYTEDIGDVCIFISMSEAFCVEASSCSGLKPNSIYFIGHGFGIYNIVDTTIHHFQAPEGAPTSFKDPYWLPPSRI